MPGCKINQPEPEVVIPVDQWLTQVTGRCVLIGRQLVSNTHSKNVNRLIVCVRFVALKRAVLACWRRDRNICVFQAKPASTRRTSASSSTARPASAWRTSSWSWNSWWDSPGASRSPTSALASVRVPRDRGCFVCRFHRLSDRLRVACPGAVQFTYDQRLEFGMTDHSNKDDALDALRRISYMNGGTATGAAISYAAHSLFR